MISYKIYNSVGIWAGSSSEHAVGMIVPYVCVDVRNSILLYSFSDFQNLVNKWTLCLYDFGQAEIQFCAYNNMQVFPAFEKLYYNVDFPIPPQ